MVQVIKLMNSILSLVTCGFSFLGFLVPDLDLDFVARGEVVHPKHLGFMLVTMTCIPLSIRFWGENIHKSMFTTSKFSLPPGYDPNYRAREVHILF